VYQHVQVFGIPGLSVKADGDSADHEIPNLGGVECRQQIDPIA
jgi:hypothetical protein